MTSRRSGAVTRRRPLSPLHCIQIYWLNNGMNVTFFTVYWVLQDYFSGRISGVIHDLLEGFPIFPFGQVQPEQDQADPQQRQEGDRLVQDNG